MSIKDKLTRREFLELTALGVAGAVVSSCAPGALPSPTAVSGQATVAPAQPTAAPAVKAPVTLEFWDTLGYGKDANATYQRILGEYTALNPSTKVNYTTVPFEQSHEKLVTAFAAGSGPDIWGCTGVYNAEFAASKYQTALDTYATDLVKDLLKATVDAMKVKGRLMALPYTNGVFGQWNRVDIFAAAGQKPPQTLDEILATGLKMTDAKNNKFMFSTRAQRQTHFMVFAWICGYAGKGVNNTLFDDKGVCVINSDAHVKAYQAWGDLFSKNKIAPPSSVTDKVPESRQLLTSGTVAMHWDWAEGIGTYNQGLKPEQFEFVPIANGPMGRAESYGPDALMLNDASKNKQEGFNVLAFLLNVKNNSDFNKTISSLPTNTKSYGDPTWQTPVYAAAKNIMDHPDWLLWVPIELPDWPQFVTQVSIDNNTKFLLGQQTAKQSLDTQAAFLTTAFKKANP